MAHVVTQACIGNKHTSCVDVCPVEAFREGPEMLFIDPEACIERIAESPRVRFFGNVAVGRDLQRDDPPHHRQPALQAGSTARVHE